MKFKLDLVACQELQRIDGPNGRLYVTPNGEKYPSVTTVLGSQPEKKSILETWKKRIGLENAERISKQASLRGTAIHKLMENYVLDEHIDTALMPTKKQIFNQIRREIDKNLTVVRGIELPLYSDTLRLAGTVDMIAEWNGVNAIIDYKTSSRLKRKEWITDYFIQTTAYSIMVEELIGISVPNVVVIIGVDEETNAQVFVEDRNKYIDPLLKVIKQYEALNSSHSSSSRFDTI